MERNRECADSFSPPSSLGPASTSDTGMSNVSLSYGATVSAFSRHSKSVLRALLKISDRQRIDKTRTHNRGEFPMLINT